MQSNRKPIRQRDLSGREHIASGRKRSSPTRIHPVGAVTVGYIKPHPHNTRTHSKKQIRQIAASIQAIGFAAPLLIDESGLLLAGHGRLEAAKLLGLKSVPVVVIDGLTEARKRALLLADNRIAQNGGWDRERLADELISLPELLAADGLDITVTGFEPAEIDALLADFEDGASDPIDDIDGV
jgi:ParB-like chromosome segregation protein Spo0J